MNELVLSVAFALSLVGPPPAAEIVQKATAQAKREHKNVLVYFHASWCPWCKRTEQLLAEPRFGSKFRTSYVIAPIDIRERAELRANENLGWEKEMARLRQAPQQDVPYLVVLSASGERLSDSYRPPVGKIPSNAGFPQTYAEIEAFLNLLRRTAPRFSAEDRASMKQYLQGVAATTHHKWWPNEAKPHQVGS